MSPEILREHRLNIRSHFEAEPVTLWEHPPNGQGLVALMALGMLEELEKTGKIPKYSVKDHNSVG